MVTVTINKEQSKTKTRDTILKICLYISFCFGFWYYMRNLTTYVSLVYLSGIYATILANVFVGSLVGGGVMYLICSYAMKKSLHPYALSGVDNKALEVTFQIAIMAANLIYGGLSFIYLAFPLLSTYGEYIIRLFVFVVCFVIATVICIKQGHIKNEFIGKSLYVVFSTFFITYGIVVIVKLAIFYTTGVI